MSQMMSIDQDLDDLCLLAEVERIENEYLKKSANESGVSRNNAHPEKKMLESRAI